MKSAGSPIKQEMKSAGSPIKHETKSTRSPKNIKDRVQGVS